MAKHGSEKRQREVTLSVRLTPEEAELVRSIASKAGMSVAGLIRYALLKQTQPRATRQPSMRRQDAAQLLGKLGPLNAALSEAARSENSGVRSVLIDAAHRDIADMRAALMEALGMSP